jgi:UDP:flavonoid glycosyltransferase YjiC (YdhE family)
MHLTLFAFGTWGDVRPLVVLGKGLQAAGHNVQIVASQGYEAWVRARHLDFYPLTDDIHKLATELSIDVYNPVQGLQIVRKVLPPVLTRIGLDVLAATRQSDVLLTVEFSIAILLGVLKVNHLQTIVINPAPLTPTGAFASAAVPPIPAWFPFPAMHNRLSYTFVQRLQWWLLGGPRRQLNQTHLGLPNSTFQEFQATLAATPTLTVVSPHVVRRPADWDEHQQITGYLFDDDPAWTPPPALSAFLAAGEPPVYIGFGSMPDRQPAATTRLCIDAVQKTGKRAVMLTGWAGLGAEDVPENIHLLQYAPHSWLFPQMAAVVHHGGAGTTAAGFRAGVPTIIVPHNADQPYWGRLARELGVGTDPIPRGRLTAAKLATAIAQATTNGAIQDRVTALRQKIVAEDGLGEAVKVINSILTGKRPSL